MTEPSLMILGRRGRRPRADVPSTKHLGIRLTEAEHRELERVAVAERKTVADVVRDAVNEFVGDFSEAKTFKCNGN